MNIRKTAGFFTENISNAHKYLDYYVEASKSNDLVAQDILINSVYWERLIAYMSAHDFWTKIKFSSYGSPDASEDSSDLDKVIIVNDFVNKLIDLVNKDSYADNIHYSIIIILIMNKSYSYLSEETLSRFGNKPNEIKVKIKELIIDANRSMNYLPKASQTIISAVLNSVAKAKKSTRLAKFYISELLDTRI